MSARFSDEPIAVTGIGLLCPIGSTRDEVWQAVVEGRSGIREVQRVDISGLSFVYGGEMDDLDPERIPPALRHPWVERAGTMTVVAAEEALQQSGLDVAALDARRLGISLGSCQYRLQRLSLFLDVVARQGVEAADPRFLLDSHVGSPADLLAAHLGARGPKFVLSNACAAGASAIGMAVDALRAHRADTMLAGGVDILEAYSMAGFDSVQAVDSRPCAPYSRSEGINLGEGAAILVLERAGDAARRGATALAYIAGYGLSSDAHHATAPDPSGAGAARAMQRALGQAGMSVDDVDYVNGHGTGTPANDHAEIAAMHTLFGSRAATVPVSSTKSQIGHTLGAAGAIEAAVCVLAVRHQVAPPTVHVDEGCRVEHGLDIVPNRGRPADISTALSSSFAFGGANCAIVVTDRARRSEVRAATDRVVVTGRGVVTSAGTMDGFAAALRSGDTTWAPVDRYPVEELGCRVAGHVTDRTHLRRIDPAYVRKLDQVSRMTVAAARMAYDDARLRIAPAERERAGLIYASFGGPAESMGATRAAAERDGLGRVSPLDFPNVVMNAAGGHACIALQLKGPTTTIVTGFVAGLTGIGYAADLLRQGEADVLLAATADELTADIHVSFDRLGILTRETPRPWDVAAGGMVPAAAGCVLVLESLEHAQQRGARIHGEVLGYAVSSDAHGIVGVDPSGRAWEECLRQALGDAGVEPEEVACVYGDGRGSPTGDRAELRALDAVFGHAGVRVATLSGQLGYATSAQAPLHVVAALETCNSGAVPEIAGLSAPLPEMGRLLWRGPVETGRNVCVVTGSSPGGTYATVVIRGASA